MTEMTCVASVGSADPSLRHPVLASYPVGYGPDDDIGRANAAVGPGSHALCISHERVGFAIARIPSFTRLRGPA